jgi:L-alanine-DL-glutamate epimerase-like enolase superfamily enzyme
MAWHRRLYDSMMHANRRGWAIMCLGALDVALWDIYGQVMGRPVWRLLGGADRCYFQHPESPQGSQPVTVTPYCTIVSDTWNDDAMVDQQVARVETLRDLGYRAFKVEPMMSEPARMIALATRAREALGPEPMLAVDVGYYFNDVPAALRVARALEELDIDFFETPFPVDRPQPWAALAAQTRVPLAMGEHGVTRWEFQAMMEHGAVSVVQPYMTTCGGLSEARAIVEQASDFGAAVVPGNWSTQILGAATVHLAAWSPRSPWIEFAPAEIFASPLRAALQRLGAPVVDGRIALPTAPGIGYTLPDELIDEYRLAE